SQWWSPGPGTVKPAETLELTCKVTGASLTDSTNMYCVNWIRQPERKQMSGWEEYVMKQAQVMLTLFKDD
ncbi:unnamed protein product, partial [Staurois parvus]